MKFKNLLSRVIARLCKSRSNPQNKSMDCHDSTRCVESRNNKTTIDAPLRDFLDSRPKIRASLRILSIIIAFFSALSVFSYLWIINNYFVDITIDVVLFHLRFPLVGVNSDFLVSYATHSLIPAILVAIFFAIRPKIALILGLIVGAFLIKVQKIIKASMLVAWQQNIPLYEIMLTFIKGGYFKSFWWNEPFGAPFVLKAILWLGAIALVIFAIFWLAKKLCAMMNLYAQSALFIALIALNFWLLDSHFHLRKYFTSKQYGDFYEKHYEVKFADSAPPHYDSKRNLIVIFVESLESSFVAENTIPNLHALANESINFSHTQGFGGHKQVGHTSWTIAGMVGYMCGIPLNSPSIIAKTFLPSAECISDTLHKMGYNQVMIMGSNDDFVAKGAFLGSHHITSKDAKYYKNIGALPSNYSHSWGFEDSKLFAFAKDELRNLADSAEHFALYLLTNNTHSPDSFIEPQCDNTDDTYQNAVKCEDKLISEFMAWVKAQDFYKNTSIVIVGDHLVNANSATPRANRRIYNAFINPRFCESAKRDSRQKSRDSRPHSANLANLTKSRNLTHFDFAPLILDSLGICAESFGLGRNPLTQKTLLEIYGNDLERFVSEDSRLYEGFWQRR